MNTFDEEANEFKTILDNLKLEEDKYRFLYEIIDEEVYEQLEGISCGLFILSDGYQESYTHLVVG